MRILKQVSESFKDKDLRDGSWALDTVLNDVMRALEADWGRGKRTLFMHFIDATGSQAYPEISHRGGITLTITNLVVVVYSIKFRDEILSFFVVIYMVVLDVSKKTIVKHMLFEH